MSVSVFAERLRNAMNSRGLKQVDLVHAAEHRGVKMGKSHISQYVAGKTMPREDVLEFLASELDVDMNWLRGEESTTQLNSDASNSVTDDEHAATPLATGASAIPVYLWLKDDGGANIKGSVDVVNREGSIEILSFGHGLYLPTDNMTGKITGTRIHSPLNFEKEFDSSSPYLYKQ